MVFVRFWVVKRFTFSRTPLANPPSSLTLLLVDLLGFLTFLGLLVDAVGMLDLLVVVGSELVAASGSSLPGPGPFAAATQAAHSELLVTLGSQAMWNMPTWHPRVHGFVGSSPKAPRVQPILEHARAPGGAAACWGG